MARNRYSNTPSFRLHRMPQKMTTISIYSGHNANITIKDQKGNFKIIELDRIFKEKYCMLYFNTPQEFEHKIKTTLKIIKEKLKIDTNYDTLLSGIDCYHRIEDIKKFTNIKKIKFFDHHQAHAATAFYQSPFKKALIISYDGGGNDGYFNFYIGNQNKKEIKLIAKSNYNLGDKYLILGYPIQEIKGNKTQMPDDLAIAGKLMGLVAYGQIKKEWITPITNFYKQKERDLNTLSKEIGINLQLNQLSGQTAYDLAATSQHVFETIFLEESQKHIEKHNLPICLTGGSALNILLNEKLRKKYKQKIYVPPNPDDSGLSLGQYLLHEPPTKKINTTYNGTPVLDQHNLKKIIKERKAQKITITQLTQKILQGKIIGIIQGNSETGPRALGNRSIICTPTQKNMKNILNQKVKYREWYRPFAPVTTQEDAHQFFEIQDTKINKSFNYMSYSPKIKKQYLHKVPAIIHQDQTSRLQTVNRKNPTILHKILTEIKKQKKIPIILNTSLNIKGKPLITTLQDALNILDQTKLDAIYTKGYLITQKKQPNHDQQYDYSQQD